MDRPSAQDWIAELGLAAHPEGGWYRETFRASRVLPAEALHPGIPGERSAGTAIYYLLTADTFSALHRVASDEIFHFYAGDPLLLHQIQPDGMHMSCTLGIDLQAGQFPQAVVSAGTWQGSHVAAGGEYTLVGCTVAPGFDFDDFELGERQALSERFPQHAELIRRLTRV